MTYGIWIKKDTTITKDSAQKLWNRGVRFIYTDITGNSLLYNNANTCAYHGFKLGLYHRLRYPPEPGSADSQAQEFAIAESKLMNLPEYKGVKFMPSVLHLEKGGPVLCETNAYRGMVLVFWQKYLSYHGETERFALKVTDDFIAWMKPTQQIVDSFDLFYHEPTALLNYKPWTKYLYRSYAARSTDGVMCEPVESWGAPIIPPVVVPPVTEPVTKMTDSEKLIAIRKILDL